MTPVFVSQVQIVLLFLLIASQIDFIIGTFLPAEDERKYGFTGYSCKKEQYLVVKRIETSNVSLISYS